MQMSEPPNRTDSENSCPLFLCALCVLCGESSSSIGAN
jgi:hypothetical protein